MYNEDVQRGHFCTLLQHWHLPAGFIAGGVLVLEHCPASGTERVKTDTALSTADGSVLLLSRAVLQRSTAAAQYTHLLP